MIATLILRLMRKGAINKQTSETEPLKSATNKRISTLFLS